MSHAKAMLFSAIGFSSFAIGDAGYKWLAAHHPIMVNAFYGSLAALCFLVLFHKPLGGIKNLRHSQNIKWHLVRASLFIGQFFFLVLAMKELSMASVYTVIFCSPFIAAILAKFFFNDPLKPIHIGVIVFGFLGVIIALQPQNMGLTIASLYAFLSACFLALANLSARKINNGSDIPLSFMIYGVIGTVIFSFCMNGLTMPLIPVSHLPAVIFAALGGSIGMYCLGQAFSKAPTSIVAPFNYLQLLWGIVIGYIIFNDQINGHMIIGAGLVIMAGIALIFYERKQHKI